MVDIGPVRSHAQHLHWCSGPTSVLNFAGQVVLELCPCGALQRAADVDQLRGDLDRIREDRQRILRRELDRLAADVITAAARKTPRPGGPLTAYWTEGPGRERLRAAPGWCAPAKPVEKAPTARPRRHWGAYDAWLKPSDRDWLEGHWRLASGVDDTSWVTTQRVR